MKVNIWTVAALVFLIWAVIVSGLAVSYYQTSQNRSTTISNLQSVVSNQATTISNLESNNTNLKSIVNDTAMQVSIGIDYGNGTVSWFNNTYVPVGVNALNATRMVANVAATYDPTYGEYYVTGINGVNGTVTSPTSGTYWAISTWENGTSTPLTVGADQYIMMHGDILVWTFESYSF
jgi:hypothetical protein